MLHFLSFFALVSSSLGPFLSSSFPSSFPSSSFLPPPFFFLNSHPPLTCYTQFTLYFPLKLSEMFGFRSPSFVNFPPPPSFFFWGGVMLTPRPDLSRRCFSRLFCVPSLSCLSLGQGGVLLFSLWMTLPPPDHGLCSPSQHDFSATRHTDNSNTYFAWSQVSTLAPAHSFYLERLTAPLLPASYWSRQSCCFRAPVNVAL